MERRPTLDEMWRLLQEERAARQAQSAELAQLRSTLAAQREEKTSVLGKLGQIERQRLSRAGLLKGVGITAAGAVVADAALSLDPPFPALAAGGPKPSATSKVKTNLATTPGYRYQTLSGLEFMPTNSSQGWSHTDNPDGISANVAGVYHAFLDVPQGAVLKEILFFVLNNSAASMVCDLYTVVLPTNSNLVGYTDVGQSAEVQTVSVNANNTAIDNGQFYYFLQWVPSAANNTQILYGARVGYTLAPLGVIKTITPVRVLDTRTGVGGYGNPQKAGTTLAVPYAILTPYGIPSSAIGIIGTLRAYAPSGDGYLTIYPGAGSPPVASNVNFNSGLTVADQVTVGLDPASGASIYVGGPSTSSTHVVFDVSGYIM